MRDFFHASSAELLKLRRTLALRLAIVAPLIIVLLQLGIYMVRGDEVAEREANPMLGYVQIIFTLWTVVFLPFYASLVASLLADLEHRGQNWSFLLTLPVDRRCLYAAKWSAGAALLLLSSAVLWLSTAGSAFLVRQAHPAWRNVAFPFGALTTHTLLSLLATSLLFSVQMWISLRFRSFMVGLSVAITGILVNIILLPHGLMLADSLIPWAMPATTIAPHSPYRLLATVWGVLGGIFTMIAACQLMSRREYR
jgi:hypothetical protein